MDIAEKLASRSDEEIQQVLSRMIKGAGHLEPALAPLMASSQDMQRLIDSVASTNEAGASIAALKQDAVAVRVILLLAAEDPALRPRLDGAIAQDRRVRDPLTAALVLAGITLVLSTKFELEYVNENGEKKFSFKVKKGATPNSILKKFFGLFGGG